MIYTNPFFTSAFTFLNFVLAAGSVAANIVANVNDNNNNNNNNNNDNNDNVNNFNIENNNNNSNNGNTIMVPIGKRRRRRRRMVQELMKKLTRVHHIIRKLDLPVDK
jgi:predicted phage tail protein